MGLTGNITKRKQLSGTLHRATGGGGSIIVDTALSSTSENPVQNKVINSALNNKADNGPTQFTVSGNNVSLAMSFSRVIAFPNNVYQFIGDSNSLIPLGYFRLTTFDATTTPYSVTFAGEVDGDVYEITMTGERSTTNPMTGTITKVSSATSPASAAPLMDGTAAVGSSAAYARADHVHPSDTSKADKIAEVTVSTAGAVTQALDAGKLYHFTGALTALTITLNAPASGGLAQYHFDFNSGSTAPTLTMPNTVMMPDSFAVEANKHYEVDVLNDYGAVAVWANS